MYGIKENKELILDGNEYSKDVEEIKRVLSDLLNDKEIDESLLYVETDEMMDEYFKNPKKFIKNATSLEKFKKLDKLTRLLRGVYNAE